MNEQLIKFIELCLVDGVITDKEREVIFRKSKELGVPDDECEILINNLVSKHERSQTQSESPKKKGGFFSSVISGIKKNVDTESIKSNFNKVKEGIKKEYDLRKVQVEQELKRIQEEQNKSTSSNTGNTKKKNSSSKFYSCNEVDIIVKHPQSMEDGRVFDLSGNRIYKISKTMREKSFKNKSYLGRKEFESGTIRWVEINPDEVENQINDSEFVKVHSLQEEENTTSKKKTNTKKSRNGTNKKVAKSIEVLKEGKTDDLIRIITSNFFLGYYCFEFKTDSIKFFKLYPEVEHDDFDKSHPCSLENSDSTLYKEIHKVSTSDSGFLEVKNGEICFEYTLNWGGVSNYHVSVKNFRYVIRSNKEESIPDRYLSIICTELEDDHSRTEDLIFFIPEDEIRNVEKILYLCNHITSHDDIDSLYKECLLHFDKLQKEKDSFVKEFDVDGNGVVDILENSDLPKLLKSNQNTLIEFEKSEGKSYVQDFVRLSNFLKDKSHNIQSLFDTLIDSEIRFPIEDNLDLAGIIRNQVHTYNLMLISSLNMIVSLVNDDRITFYEIYESFDKLNVFSSNHEKEVSKKLTNIGDKLEEITDKLGEVMQSIHDMEVNICNELMSLQFISGGIANSLGDLSKGLEEINSSINTNNLLTGIQTYQMYKINQNTKSLKG